MKVSTRIILGFVILLAIAFAGLGYQLSVIRQMESINRDLSLVNFHAASTTLEMLQLVETIKEFSRKYFAVVDPIYQRQLEDYRKDFLESLTDLRKTVRSNNERVEAERLAEAFDDYSDIFDRAVEAQKTRDLGALPPDLEIAIDHLQAQTAIAYDAVNVSIQDEVARATEAGKRAEEWSAVVGLLALVLSVAVAVVIVGAINDRLRRLTQGTRVIAKGQFRHRLPVYGNDEFSELARDFNVMTQKLGELDEMKKDFVSHVSHDLKAPLASMRQVTHILLEQIPGSLNEQQQNLLRLSHNSAERLSTMVGNLLDVSRMEAGTMEYEIQVHDIVPLIRTVAEEFDIQAREKDIRIRIECEQPIAFAECDRDRIAQVVGNIFENALKFSPRNGEIVVRVSGAPPNATVHVSIADSGPGIPDEHKEKIFLKFHQLRQGKKLAGQGVGLGLAICKTIIDAHGGRLWVEDGPNGGSVFSFTLQGAVRKEIVRCEQNA